ncbi:uncharacterized protein TNCV_1300371 [Trichonephila clavipes]|nr:uncharacterized protein TNCV_1300371 [Trichonephila clavipes]
MLNDAKIVTSMQEESNPVDYETDEDEDNNNNESSKGPSNADAFFVLETAMEWYEKQPECYPTYLLLLKRIRDLAAKKRRRRMDHHSALANYGTWSANCGRQSKLELLLCGRGSLVVKVTNSWPACHVFQPSTVEDPPCWGSMHFETLTRPPVSVVWELRDGGASSDVVLVT